MDRDIIKGTKTCKTCKLYLTKQCWVWITDKVDPQSYDWCSGYLPKEDSDGLLEQSQG